MRTVEERTGRLIEDLITELYHGRGLSQPEVAAELSRLSGVPIPHGTLRLWLLRLGLDRSSLARRALEQSG